MRKSIDDEFTALKISRQRKYQLRKQRENCCTECGAPALGGLSRCMKHLVAARERQRKKRHCKRRYFNTPGYRLETGQRVSRR